jgi:hypothetical protein
MRRDWHCEDPAWQADLYMRLRSRDGEEMGLKLSVLIPIHSLHFK